MRGTLTLETWDLRAAGSVRGRLENVALQSYKPGGFGAGINESGCLTTLPLLEFEAVLDEEVSGDL